MVPTFFLYKATAFVIRRITGTTAVFFRRTTAFVIRRTTAVFFSITLNIIVNIIALNIIALNIIALNIIALNILALNILTLYFRNRAFFCQIAERRPKVLRYVD